MRMNDRTTTTEILRHVASAAPLQNDGCRRNNTCNNNNKKKKNTLAFTTMPTSPATTTPETSCSSGGTSPVKPSASPEACQTPSGPSRHTRARTAPACSMSTPLARSLSMREPATHRKRGDRLDGASLTTYRDDYRPPGAMSYKLHSLNLETSVRTLPDPSTTYRESFQWPQSFSRRDACSGAGSGNRNKVKDVATNSHSKGSHFESLRFVGGVSQPETPNPETPRSVQSDLMNHILAKPFARRPLYLSKDSSSLMMRDENRENVSATKRLNSPF